MTLEEALCDLEIALIITTRRARELHQYLPRYKRVRGGNAYRLDMLLALSRAKIDLRDMKKHLLDNEKTKG